MGIALEAEKFCLLLAKLENLLYHGLVVVAVIVVAASVICLIYLFAQFAVVGILQERNATGLVECEYPAIAVFACSSVYNVLWQAGEVFLVGDDQLECLVVGKQVVAELY